MKKFSSITKASSRHSFFAKKRTRVIVGWLVLLVLAAFVLPRVVGGVSDFLLTPFVSLSSWLRESPGTVPVYFRERSTLLAERDALRAEIDQQAALALTVKRLTEENISLRAYHGEGKPDRLLVRVLARPPFLPYDLIQLDKGSNDGVVVGAPVYAGRDVVVGAVVEVGPRYSFVQLVTAPGFVSTVYLPSAKLVATMEGIGGGVARVRFAQGVRVTPGDIVLMLAYDGGVYGEVTHIEGVPTQPEQYAYVSSPQTLSSLRFLTVGKKLETPPVPAEIASSTKAIVEQYFYVPEVATLLTPSSTATSTLETATSTP